jgi:hypothetical protein
MRTFYRLLAGSLGMWLLIAGTLALTPVAQGKGATVTPASSTTPVPCRDAFEDDGIPARARPLVIGEPQAHLLCPAGDAEWLTFFAHAGKGYQIATTQLGPGVDTYLYLFAPDARTVLAYNDDGPATPGASQLIFHPQVDGWYFVMVKNQSDIGFPGARYTVSLSLVSNSTATAAPVATTTPDGAGDPAPSGDLLQPVTGGTDSDRLPVFAAGPADGLHPDALEPNDAFTQAAPVALGAVYQRLNFVPATPGQPDADFYVFRAKPGNCYRVQTADLSPGLDTTILLWRAAATGDGHKLVAQNDDAHPHTADLSSAVRWCSGADAMVVAEIGNYGLAPLTDPRGKTYSLTVQIDAPTSVPAATPRTTGSEANGPAGPGAQGVVPPVRSAPGGTLNPPTPASAPTPSPLPVLSPLATSAPPTALGTPIITPAASPTRQGVSVDVVAYVGEPDAVGPLQGDGIVGWPVQLVDQRSNEVLQTVLTDANGHARLTWAWSGSVWIELPTLRWSHLVLDPTNDPALAGGPLYARKETYPLPGIWP